MVDDFVSLDLETSQKMGFKTTIVMVSRSGGPEAGTYRSSILVTARDFPISVLDEAACLKLSRSVAKERKTEAMEHGNWKTSLTVGCRVDLGIQGDGLDKHHYLWHLVEVRGRKHVVECNLQPDDAKALRACKQIAAGLVLN